MNYTSIIYTAAILILSSCGVNTNKSKATSQKPDVVENQNEDKSIEKVVFAKMEIEDTIKIGDMAQLRFTVYNYTDSIQQFCKWHTPFEPLMSKYLNVKDENGVEIDYLGPMAKRIMPPPASSYIQVNSKDSISSVVDLLKSYAIKSPSKYTITYAGQNMSGLVVKDSVSFVYTK